MTFGIHTLETASEEAKPVLVEVKKAYGSIPNLYGVFAESPAALQAYLTLNNIFEQSSSFNAIERQVVLMTASFENNCRYCMAAQSVVAPMQGVPPRRRRRGSETSFGSGRKHPAFSKRRYEL